MKSFFYYAGVLAALGAVVLSLAGANIGANGMPQDVHPLGGVGLGVAALAFFKASELAPK